MEKDLIACCGVDCSACSDHADKKCPGCRKTDWQPENICLPVACCRKKRISFCGECSSFPCASMRDFYKESESHEKAYALMTSVRKNGQRPAARGETIFPDRRDARETAVPACREGGEMR